MKYYLKALASMIENKINIKKSNSNIKKTIFYAMLIGACCGSSLTLLKESDVIKKGAEAQCYSMDKIDPILMAPEGFEVGYDEYNKPYAYKIEKVPEYGEVHYESPNPDKFYRLTINEIGEVCFTDGWGGYIDPIVTAEDGYTVVKDGIKYYAVKYNDIIIYADVIYTSPLGYTLMQDKNGDFYCAKLVSNVEEPKGKKLER